MIKTAIVQQELELSAMCAQTPPAVKPVYYYMAGRPSHSQIYGIFSPRGY